MWLECRILLAVLLASCGSWAKAESGDPSGPVLHRQKRIVCTSSNCATGILVALSVPLIIPARNIFMSYNFEMNYNMPSDATDYSQGVLKRVESPDIHDSSGRAAAGGNGTIAGGEEEARILRRSATFTRKKAYRTLEINLNKMGLKGKRCVLRAICEAQEIPMYEANGVLGDLMQILLTPSYSEDEKLPAEFYRAEVNGHSHTCEKYRRYCSKSILDVISVLF